MKKLTNQKKKEILCLIGVEGGDPMEVFQKSSITDPIEFGRYVDWLIDNRFICFEEHYLIWSGFSSMDALQEVIKDQRKPKVLDSCEHLSRRTDIFHTGIFQFLVVLHPFLRFLG